MSFCYFLAQNLCFVQYRVGDLTTCGVSISGDGVFRIWWGERHCFHLPGSYIQHIGWRLVHFDQVQGEAREGKAAEGAVQQT
jgi:hypothetical protein